jgi:hypothetical protein
MFNADICLSIPCLFVLGPRVGGGPVPEAPGRSPSSYTGCRCVAVMCRRRSLSSANRTDDGGRGSELLLRRPACHVSSAAGCGGGGDCDPRASREVGRRILIEELRSLEGLDREVSATGAGACGAGIRVVVVMVGCVVVVD